MENYENQISVIAKPSYYGGRLFIKYNTKTKVYYMGNTASTAVSESAGVKINNVTQKELKNTLRQLHILGYTGLTGNGNSIYETSEKAGLV
jgi:hypothetical protein